MYVCICHEVTDREISCAIRDGACSMEDLAEMLSVGTNCGRCSDCAKSMLNNSSAATLSLDLQAA